MVVRILYAEDDEVIRRMLSKTLDGKDVEVIPCENGEDALAKFREERTAGRSIDLVITDIHMPDMDGTKLIEMLRGEGFKGEIGIVSGNFSDKKFLGTYRVFYNDFNTTGCLEAYKRLKTEESEGR